MTRAEAQDEARRLGAEHPDRTTHSWIAREREPGEWAVVKIGVPTRGPEGTLTEAKPSPPMADDPRPALWRDVGGPYGGG
jgi:hypothetical protein